MQFLSVLAALAAMGLGLFSTIASAQEAARTADVLIRPVARGTILKDADFTSRVVSPLVARGALDRYAAEGLATTRALPAGTPLRPGDVAEAALVHRGEAVTLSLRSGGLVISAQGRALTDGPMGATVRVVNLATNRTLDAIVEGEGRVSIAAPL